MSAINVQWPSKNLTNFTEYIGNENGTQTTALFYGDTDTELNNKYFYTRSFFVLNGQLTEYNYDDLKYYSGSNGVSFKATGNFVSTNVPLYINNGVTVYGNETSIILSDFFSNINNTTSSLTISKYNGSSLNNNIAELIYNKYKDYENVQDASVYTSKRLQLLYQDDSLEDTDENKLYFTIGPKHIGLEYISSGVNMRGIYFSQFVNGSNLVDKKDGNNTSSYLYLNEVKLITSSSINTSGIEFSDNFRINSIYKTKDSGSIYKYDEYINNDALYLWYKDMYDSSNANAYIYIDNNGKIGGNGTISLRNSSSLTIKLSYTDTYTYDNSSDVTVNLYSAFNKKMNTECTEVTNWNVALNNGYYYSTLSADNIPVFEDEGSTAAQEPTTEESGSIFSEDSYLFGTVIAHDNMVIQKVYLQKAYNSDGLEFKEYIRIGRKVHDNVNTDGWTRKFSAWNVITYSGNFAAEYE